MDLPTTKPKLGVSLNDFALIDEISGLNNFLDTFMSSHNIPETTKDRIRARMFRYNSEKPKEVALNEIREAIFGTGR